MNDLISVIMPAYNAEAFISQSIKSVIQQEYMNWELIVINDCSTDNTAIIVKKFQDRDSRIKLINLDNNMGAPAGPRNIGVMQSKGDWVAFLDSDDIWHSQKLKIQLLELVNRSSLFCSTKMIDFSGDDYPPLKLDHEYQVSNISFREQLLKNRTPTSSVVVAKSLLLSNPFNESLAYKAREDLDCWLHCHEIIQKSIKINSPLIGYRIIENQISGNKLLMVKRHFHVLKNYKFLCGEKMSIFQAFFYTLTHFTSAFFLRNRSQRM